MYLPDDVPTNLSEIKVDASMLKNGSLLKDITLPYDTLVIMIKHDQLIKVSRGDTRLYLGDTLLQISEDSKF